ncbi:MAG: MarR family transcriptional regulator [Clostridiales bacterium]|nr:MarR family transcriptional regulator [Clostridiales bacterium]MCF8023623.1 MarR family transcriptional regulator [Clostridiales bacterium]
MKKEESIGRWISMLYRYGQIYVGKKLHSYGIGKGQFMYLIKLFNEDGLSQDRLTEKLNMDKGTTARALKKLEEQGFVTREGDENDRRSKRVFLTTKARELKPLLFSVLKDWNEILSQGLSKEEKEQVLKILEKMANNASEFTREEREKE